MTNHPIVSPYTYDGIFDYSTIPQSAIASDTKTYIENKKMRHPIILSIHH